MISVKRIPAVVLALIVTLLLAAILYTGVSYAHAVNLCTHKDGVISNLGGGTRHVTNFVKHTNTSHVTRTKHQRLTTSGWITTDTFTAYASRRSCNCQ